MKKNSDSPEVSQWLSRISQYSSKSIDLGLDRVKSIATQLNLIHFDCPVILVAGTNGKGSCVHLLEEIYNSAGYQVGISTSPHFHRINERVCINKKEVSDDLLLDAFEHIEKIRKDTRLTYFEFTTLSFLYILKYQLLDVIILEIGLGGKLDAMNVVEPDVSIITSVDLDHMDYLGKDRESIGREKAGVFRAGKPAICGDPNPPRSIGEEAERVGAKLYFPPLSELCEHESPTSPVILSELASVRIQSKEYGLSGSSRNFSKEFVNEFPEITQDDDIKESEITQDDDWGYSILSLNLPSVLKTLDILQNKLPVEKNNISLNNIKIPGRFEVTHNKCKLVLDVAHNPAACKQFAKQLERFGHSGKVYAICSFLNDKDICACIKALDHCVDEWHTAELKCERATKIDDLYQTITDISKRRCYTHPSISDGLVSVLKKSNKSDLCLVFGSFFTVAEAREYLL